MMKYKAFLISLFCIVSSNLNAGDTLKTINALQVLEIVRNYHPIAKQASISVMKSKADVLISRGAFDPILSHYTSSKTFDGTNYYNYSVPELTIPTWYGIEIKGGFENLSGTRTDPMETLGQTNFVGINVPLAKNLVLDKRRAFLKQAKIFNSMAYAEQKAIINNLLMESMEAYWSWVKAYQTYKVVNNNVLINEQRLELVKKSFINGERPSIDTIEAKTQLQSFIYQRNVQWLEFQNSGLQLSVYLWNKDGDPYQMPESVVPSDDWENEAGLTDFEPNLEVLILLANQHHPELSVYDYKLSALNIDKNLKFQDVLPKIDFRYNQLGKGYNLYNTSITGPLFENNFQYGLKVEIPLRFSQGRGDYRKAKLKIEETKLSQSQKQLSVQLKVKKYYNDFINLIAQIDLQSNAYSNYTQLVSAEETKLFNGESSLFLVNSRENKALDALEKLIDLKTKYFKTVYALQWSAGLLN